MDVLGKKMMCNFFLANINLITLILIVSINLWHMAYQFQNFRFFQKSYNIQQNILGLDKAL